MLKNELKIDRNATDSGGSSGDKKGATRQRAEVTATWSDDTDEEDPPEDLHQLPPQRPLFSTEQRKRELLSDTDTDPMDSEEHSDPEHTVVELEKLSDFLIRKCHWASVPLNIAALGEEYAAQTGVRLRWKTLDGKIRTIRKRIENMKELDKETKVKTLFGLSVAVGGDYLEELRKEALVEVDDKNRIINFKANDGSLHLEGEHSSVAKRRSSMFQLSIEDFLVSKCQNTTTPLSISQLSRDYKLQTNATQSPNNFHMKISQLRMKIARMSKFDKETKVKMLFGLSAPIGKDFSKILRKDALVKVDRQNRITKYEANDGSLKLNGDHSVSAKSIAAQALKTPETSLLGESDDNDGSLKLKGDHSLSTKTLIGLKYKKSGETSRLDESEESAPDAQRTNISRHSVPVESEDDSEPETVYMTRLRRRARLAGAPTRALRVDPSSSDGSLSDSEPPKEHDLKEFLIRKCQNCTAPLSIAHLAEEYKEQIGATQSVKSFEFKIANVRDRVPEMEDVDEETKLRILFGLSAQIGWEHLKKLRKTALVKVDDRRRIIKYRANDGSLELEGNHSSYAKMRSWTMDVEHITEHSDQEEDDGGAKSDADEHRGASKTSESKDIFDFVVRKSRNISAPFNITQLCREYKEQTGAQQNLQRLVYRIRTLRRRIPGMEDLDEETKVKMLFGLGAQIEGSHLKGLRKTAQVKVDTQNRIIKYRAKDGSLNLEGDHDRGVKIREARARMRKEVVTLDDNDDSDGKDDGGDNGDVEVIQVKKSRRVLPRRASTGSRGAPGLRRSTRLSAPLIGAPKRELICGEDEELIGSAPPRKRYRIKNYMQTIDSLTQQLKESSGRIGGGGGVTVKTEPFDEEEEERVMETRDICSETFKARRFIKREVLDFDYETVSVSPIPMRNDHPEEILIDIPPSKSSPTFDFITGPQAIIDFRAESSANAPEGAPVPSQMISLTSTAPKISLAKASKGLNEPEVLQASPCSIRNAPLVVSGEKEPEPRLEVKPEVFLIPNAKTPTTRLISVSDHIRFLEAIHTTIISMDIPILKQLQQRIETRIQKIQLEGNRGENVVMSELNAAVVTCLQMIHKSMGMREESSEEIGRSSLREFLLILRTSIVGLKLPILQQSERKIKKMMAELATGGDKKLPINKIAFSLQTILEFIAP